MQPHNTRASPNATNGVAWTASVIAMVAIAQQIASKSLRDGLFLTEYEVARLPYVVGASAVLSFFVAIGLGRLMSSLSPAVAVPLIFTANSLMFFAEAAFASQAPRTIAVALYLHTAAFGGGVVSGFWSVINERFDPYAARRVMGRIAGGATLGGMLGGGLTWLLAELPSATLLTALGIASLACGFALVKVAAGNSRKAKSASGSIFEGIKVISNRTYPRSIALLVFAIALVIAIVDYVFKAGVAAAGEESLVGFFAMFYTGTGVLTFMLQTLASRRVLKWAGVVPTVASLPATLLPLLLLALMVPGLVTLVVLRGVGMVVENSLFRSGYELLYAAAPPSEKRSAKILIDLGCDRLGTAAGSGLALVAVTLAALANQFLLTAALVFIGCVAGLLTVLRRQYVTSLAAQIRGETSPDATHEEASLSALASTFVGSDGYAGWLAEGQATRNGDASNPSPLDRLDRAELLAQVRELAERKRALRPTPESVLRPRTSTVSARLLATPLLQVVQQALAEPPEGPKRAELYRSAPATLGQLTDILLSGRQPAEVRILAAELLASVPAERTAAGLLQAMLSPEFRVRRAAALALLQITTRAPALRPRARVLAKLASNELQRPSRLLREENEFELTSPFREDARGNTIASSLELALIVLAVRGDRKGLRLALSAVTSTDPAQRGTGLEYLDNLLPGNLRSRILGLVEHPEMMQASNSVPSEVIAKLATDFRARKLDLRQLRMRYRAARQASYDQA